MNILIVDDEPAIRDTLSIMLGARGYRVTTASNGEEALCALSGDTDLVVTDIVMPEKDGLELLMTARQLFPDLPFIAMSGGGIGSPGSYLHVALKLGAKATLLKPVSGDALIATIRALLTRLAASGLDA